MKSKCGEKMVGRSTGSPSIWADPTTPSRTRSPEGQCICTTARLPGIRQRWENRDTRKTVATAAVSTDDWKYLALSSMSKSSSPRGGLWMSVSERHWKPRDFVGIRSSVQKRCTTMWTTVYSGSKTWIFLRS